jgi:hypothetical protein
VAVRPTRAGGSYSGILRLSKIWGEQENIHKLHEKTLIITPRGVQSNVGQNLTQKFKSLKVRKVQLRIDGGGEFTYNGPHLSLWRITGEKAVRSEDGLG